MNVVLCDDVTQSGYVAHKESLFKNGFGMKSNTEVLKFLETVFEGHLIAHLKLARLYPSIQHGSATSMSFTTFGPVASKRSGVALIHIVLLRMWQLCLEGSHLQVLRFKLE